MAGGPDRIGERELSSGPLRQRWFLFAGAFATAAALGLVRLVTDGWRPLDVLLAGSLIAAGVFAVRFQATVQELEAGRRTEAEGFARIVRGLSRSVSPESIVEAIVEELGHVVAADHVVVVRRARTGRGLEATLVSRRPGVPNATTLIPTAGLDRIVADATDERGSHGRVASEPVLVRRIEQAWPSPRGLSPDHSSALVSPERTDTAVVASGRQAISAPTAVVAAEASRSESMAPVAAARTPGDRPNRPAPLAEPDDRPGRARFDRHAARSAADELGRRAASVYGLPHTLAEPLVAGDLVVGALVLSRRTDDRWPAAVRRLLAAAAVEASVALERAYSHREAETAATTDALTGLPNRRYFDEFCGLLARRRRADDAVGVLMVDIDRFKVLNDRHGHVVGDEALRAVAAAISGTIREVDVPARFGGEEFVVLLRNPSPAIARDVAERVRAAVERLDLADRGIPRLTVSVGVAVASRSDEPIREIVDAADAALYRAKRGGRNRVAFA